VIRYGFFRIFRFSVLTLSPPTLPVGVVPLSFAAGGVLLAGFSKSEYAGTYLTRGAAVSMTPVAGTAKQEHTTAPRPLAHDLAQLNNHGPGFPLSPHWTNRDPP